MSRIASLAVSTHRNDLGGGLWNPAFRWVEKFAVFVEVADDEGWRGAGECWCFDARPDALVAFLRTEVLPEFIDLPVAEVEERCRRLIGAAALTARHGILSSALSGVDIAVRDLLARRAGVPLWQALGPDATGTAPLYASGGLYGERKGLPELAKEIADMRGKGFAMAKIKVGGLDRESDLARARTALDALPPGGRLIVDGVGSFGSGEALDFYRALPEGRIEAFQSPVAPVDLEGMARLAREGVPVMAGEAEYRPEIHRQLVEEAGVAFLQTAPIASGGVGCLMRLQELVAGGPTRLSLEVSSTAVALMAACHAAAAMPSVAHVEFHYVHQVLFGNLALSPVLESPGLFALPTTPGLGVEPAGEGIRRRFRLTGESGRAETSDAAGKPKRLTRR